MKNSFLNEIKEKINEERCEIVGRGGFYADMLSADTCGDPVDRIQGTILVSFQNQINARKTNKLMQLDNALKRIDNEDYGLCEDCEEEIPEKRLMANPIVLTCICCAEDRESI